MPYNSNRSGVILIVYVRRKPLYSAAIADFILAILLETIFLVQIYAVGRLPVPFIADVASYLHLSLLYALYSFEYRWMSSGWSLVN